MPKVVPSNRLKAEAMYRRGMTAAAIARELGISKERACQLLRPKFDTATIGAERTSLANKAGPKKAAQATAARIRLRRLEVLEIAKRGVGARTVARALGIGQQTARTDMLSLRHQGLI